MNFSPARSRYDCDIISQERRFIIKKGGIRIFRADNLDGWRDGQSEQVQRTESFNLIYRFDRAATICVKRDLSNLLSLSPSLPLSLSVPRARNLWIFTRIPLTDPITSTFRPASFLPLSLGLRLFFPLFPRSRSSFWAPVVDVLCHASYFHARTRRLHLLKAIHYDSKIISSIRLDGGEGDTL